MSGENAFHRLMKTVLRSKKAVSAVVPQKMKSAVRDRIYKRSYEEVLKARELRYSRTAFSDGINLIGQIKGEYGLGESCRLVYREIEASGVPCSVYNYSASRRASENDTSLDHVIGNSCPKNINLIHINPEVMPEACFRLGKDILSGRYNIGLWLWEQQEFPEKWRKHFSLVDEIWTPSEFVSNMFRDNTNLPVVTVPYALPPAEPDKFTREDFGLPEGVFLVLMMYDSASSSERKNPKAAIKAYKKAFSPDKKDVAIVIKTMNSSDEELRQLHEQLKGYENVYIICECMQKKRLNALIRLSDVYLSLHRSEGFGLILAEAMQRGTAVVATDWSANVEFMTEDTACLVKSKIIELDKDYGPYPKGTHWADPDPEDAANYLRLLYKDRKYLQEMTERAKLYIDERLSLNRAADIIRKRTELIYSEWK